MRGRGRRGCRLSEAIRLQAKCVAISKSVFTCKAGIVCGFGLPLSWLATDGRGEWSGEGEERKNWKPLGLMFSWKICALSHFYMAAMPSRPRRQQAACVCVCVCWFVVVWHTQLTLCAMPCYVLCCAVLCCVLCCPACWLAIANVVYV